MIDGYTVDSRLREFRKLVIGESAEFISLDSEKGEELLCKYWKKANTSDLDWLLKEFETKGIEINLRRLPETK